MTTAEIEQTIHEGELILDECNRAGIGLWISPKTGSLLAKHCNGRPYFVRQLRENEYAVKLAIAHREAME